MTEKQLFRRYYRIARLTAGTYYGDNPFAEELEILAIAAAVRAGMDDYSILGIKHSAAIALEEREKPHTEPSRNSVAIQSMMFTFDRVRRSFI